MHISTPTDKCHFGKHRGHSFADIYKFEPSYIEWAVVYVSDFIINILEFENLPTPTPYIHFVKFGKHEVSALTDESVKLGKQQLAAGKTPAEAAFKFGKELHIVIEQKMEGTYTPPNWEKIIYEPIDKKIKGS
ncbi:MAG: hypothetical protein GXC78_18345 [Chitinophagaceae bacterium]|nr:hypothetical protein [Chitinophagaceae bacterium]